MLKKPKLKIPKKPEHARLLEKVITEAIHKDRHLFDALSPRERELAIDLLARSISDRSEANDILSVLWEADFIRRPVGVREFLSDPYYLGKTCKTLAPKWVDDLEAVCSPGSTITEWILTGALGVGKTTAGMAAMIYKVYQLSCLKDAASYYGLLPNSMIVFGIYSITKDQANNAAYWKVREYIDNSPYFKSEFPRNQKLESSIEFLRSNIQIISGCVAEGTLVSTPQGEVPVESLAQTSPQLLTLCQSGLPQPARYAGVKETGEQATLRIADDAGRQLVCTHQHKVLVQGDGGSYGWKVAKDIRVGDYLLTVQKASPDESLSHRQADGSAPVSVQDMPVGEYVRTGETPKREENTTRIPKAELRPEELPIAVREKLREFVGGDLPFAFTQPNAPQGRYPARYRMWDVLQTETRKHRIAANPNGPIFARRPFSLEWGDRLRFGPHLSPPTPPRPNHLTGYAFFKGTASANGVLWEKAMLLAVSDHHEVTNVTDKAPDYDFCDLLPMSGEDVGFTRASTNHDDSPLPPYQVAPSRVVSIEDAGIRKTYDVIHVQNDTASVVTNGIVSSNSRGFHSIGLDVFGFCLDEANFMTSKLDKNTNRMVGQAYELFEGTSTRLASRFLRPGGTVPGLSLLMSSKTNRVSFVESRVRAISGKPDIEFLRGPITPKPGSEQKQPTAYVSSYALWEIRHGEKYSGRKFKVQVGDIATPSSILPEGTPEDEDATIIEVPVELRDRFDQDIDAALRDLAGISTLTVYPFIRNGTSVFNAINAKLPNPFPNHTLVGSTDVADTFDCDGDFVIKTCHVENSVYVPNHFPDEPRYIHVDLALTGDAAAVSMGFMKGYRVSQRVNPNNNSRYDVRHPIIQFDFNLRIIPNPGHEIEFSKIRSFITFISQFYRIAQVSFDGFQSAGEMQILRAEGFTTKTISLDRNSGPYMTTRSAFREGRVILPHTHFDPVLKRWDNYWVTRELIALVFDSRKNKVDHPERNLDGSIGSKDLADTVAGVISAITEAISIPSTPVRKRPIEVAENRAAKIFSKLRKTA